MLKIHLSNEAVGVIPNKIMLWQSWEDSNIDQSFSDAMINAIDTAAPDRFVLIETGDYIIPECANPNSENWLNHEMKCSVYDPFYVRYLVPVDVWRKYEWLVNYIDQEWRESANCCKMPEDTHTSHYSYLGV